MAVEKQRLRINRLAAAAIGAVGLAALTLPSAPAQARVFVDIGVGVPGVWGYYAPRPYYYSYPGYYGYGYPYYYHYPYAYRAYYGRPIWHPYWHPYWHRVWHRGWHRRWR
jgi:hypothetical protein